MSKIPICKPYHDEEIESNVIRVLRSGRLVSGPEVEAFERELANYIGCKHVICVNSGTAALHLAFEVLEVKGKKVVTSPFSFAATANSILYAGGTPVFVDIDLETYNLDVKAVRESIDEDVVAIEPVDLFGHPAELDEILKIAGEKELKVVEDAAQAIGAEYKGVKIGSISDITCFSTYATKNLHTGEGGFLTTNDDETARRLRILRNQGQDGKYNHVALGYNYRMTEIQAAIGRVQLKKIEELTEARIKNAEYLTKGLKQVDGLILPKAKPYVRHVYNQYAIRIDSEKLGYVRDQIVKEIINQGVEAAIHYPKIIPLQPYYKAKFHFKEGCFPAAEEASKTIFSIPVHPFLTTEQLDKIIDAVEKAVSKIK